MSKSSFMQLAAKETTRLFHVESRDIAATADKIILREFFFVIDYAKFSQHSKHDSSGFL